MLKLLHEYLLFIFHVTLSLILIDFLTFMNGQAVQNAPHLTIPLIFLSLYSFGGSGTFDFIKMF